MREQVRTAQLSRIFLVLAIGAFSTLWAATVAAQTGAWLTHSHDEQHTALSTVQSQPLSSIHWHTPVDLFPPLGEIFIPVSYTHLTLPTILRV